MTYRPAGDGIYGDGSDGDVNLTTGTTTLVRDMYYRTLIVGASAIVIPAGFRIFVQQTLTIAGNINNDGGAGESQAATSTNSSAGLAVVWGSSTLGRTQHGGSGRYNAAGIQPSNALTTITGMVAAAGAGGAGSTTAGGAAGALTSAGPDTYGGYRHIPACLLGVTFGWNSTFGSSTGVAMVGFPLVGGPGGGGGGGDNTRSGGGGGAGGGPILIAARTLIISSGGFIRSAGGAGGAGATGGNCGGGGGGSGGPILLTYNSLTNAGTISAPGGAAGAKTGTGTIGNAGSAGAIIQVVNA